MAAEVRTRADWTLALAGLCWLGVGEFFVAEAMAGLHAVNYSPLAHDISFLGLTSCPYVDAKTGRVLDICSPWHGVMNAGLTLSGLLQIFGALFLWRHWPGRVVRFGLMLIVLAGIGAALVGRFPLDLNPRFHGWSAITYFSLMPLALLVLGFAWRSTDGKWAALSYAAGALSALGVVFYASEIYLLLGRGGMERLAVYPTTIWFMALGAGLLWQVWGKRSVVAGVGV